jgi:type 1 fimbria pilin
MRISQLITRSAVLCAFAAAGAAHAQSANVTVQGLIVPPACSAQFVGGAELDWGSISHNSLSATTMTVLSHKDVTLQVSCDQGLTTHMALWAVDANPQSALVGIQIPESNSLNGNDATRIFGIGMDPITGKKLGNFTMIPTSSSYDQNVSSANYGFVQTSTHTETSFNVTPFKGSGAYQLTTDHTILDSANKPALASTFTYTMSVYPQLNTSSAITNAQEVPFSGAAQFYVRYF